MKVTADEKVNNVVSDALNKGKELNDEVKHSEEYTEEQYVPGEPFDHMVEHSDVYYEQYIQNFKINNDKKLFYRFVKRLFDIVASFLMLIILSPVMLMVAIAVKCDSKGSVIFKQQRMGKNKKSFNCYKFRTMKTDAPRNCATSQLKNSEQYLTRTGRFLRKSSLDELPQLWCILVGDMSFIGYRPLVLTEEKCNAMRDRLNVFSARPGISGYAQVLGRDDVYYKNKAILDAEYVKKASLLLDLRLIFRTVIVVFKKEGIK